MMKASLVFALFLVGAVAQEEQPLDVGGPAEVDNSEAVPGAFIEASAQQGVGVSAGVGSSEQAYWLPPASGGMVGGPPQGGPGGGGGGGGGAPMMQATPSSPYTSAYSVQPQAFYNLLESNEHEGQRMHGAGRRVPRRRNSEAVPSAFIEASAQQGVGVSEGVGSSEQAYWLPPASGGMVGGPPQGGPGGGGGGPGGAPMMQATPSSPYTSAYSVQPQAFYNLLESYEHEGQRLLAPPAGPHQFYYIHNAHPDQYAASMQNEMRFKRRQSAYHRNKAGYTVIHDESRSAYKMKRSGKHHHHLAKHAKPAAETAEVRFKAEASLEKVPKHHKQSSLSHKLKKAAQKLHHQHKHNHKKH
eukprot:g1025.t1